MPKNRNANILPKDVAYRLDLSEEDPFFGKSFSVEGGRLIRRPKKLKDLLTRGQKTQIQYSMQDNILSRTEFVQTKPAIPVHMAHYDAETGKRFAVVVDYF